MSEDVGCVSDLPYLPNYTNVSTNGINMMRKKLINLGKSDTVPINDLRKMPMMALLTQSVRVYEPKQSRAKR